MEIQNTPHTSRMNWFASFILTLALVVSGTLIFGTLIFSAKNLGPMFKPESIRFLWPFFLIVFIAIWLLLSKLFQTKETETSLIGVLAYFIVMIFLLILASGMMVSYPFVRDILKI